MNTLNLLRAYCSPLRKGHPALGDVERKFQTGNSRTSPKRTWLVLLIGLFAITLGVLGIRKGLPYVSETVPTYLNEFPIELQLLVVALVGAPIAAGIAYGIFRLFRRFAERRMLQMHIQKIHGMKKLMVYVYGSGALGFNRALDKLSDNTPIETLNVFCHPPASSNEKGGVKILGAITGIAPVQHAMNSLKSAIAARGSETSEYSDAHRSYLEATGAIRTDCEWSIIHLGEGHTSLSCHHVWERDRTTTLVGAHPGKYFIVVKIASPRVVEDEQTPDGYWDDSDETVMTPRSGGPSLVKVFDDSSEATGVVVGPDGLVLTCAHAVNENKSIRVSSADGKWTPATVVAQNDASDIALLQCMDYPVYVKFGLANSSSLDKGQEIAALGCKSWESGHPEVLSPSYSAGTLSQVVSDSDNTYLKTDLPIDERYCGGALVTEAGKLAGLITSPTSTNGLPSEVAMAVSSQDIFKEFGLAVPDQQTAMAAD